jgi:hypothetical protein
MAELMRASSCSLVNVVKDFENQNDSIVFAIDFLYNYRLWKQKNDFF